ncbi:MAG TPA: M1 family aminopeptidase [Candidatus Dormibacteraeota bacterium]|nr:M1 family aminopeptidase [Candidatus Dormibacteraeota bacterium]
MIRTLKNVTIRRHAHVLLMSSLAFIAAALPLVADEPFARTRDYDLQHSKIALRFDLDQKKVFGDVTHTLSIFRDTTAKIAFDSVGLTIESVTVNDCAAKFETTADKLLVPLPPGTKSGEKLDIAIHYQGQPTKGLYFILPDKDYPDRPKQIWTQGESEDTRYYLPTYDYPNDRLTTETILTVPASWITVSNGKLISVNNAGNNMKTWTWREALPSSTYLITVVAGEFDEVKDSWRNIPVTYYAPKGRGDRLYINYGRTPAMIDLFSKKLGVDYAWEKYAQSMVDEFIAGGMENSSATTNTSSSLVHPKLAPEYATGQDELISHELGHQWFGDLVTTKDWGNLWLNEGFATFMETVWIESNFPKDQGEYERWNNAREWFSQPTLYKRPIVRHDFDDSSIFDGNSYNKAGWVLYMLRHQLGEHAFYAGLHHYLEANRGKNVVTSDLVKAIDDATHINVDQFFTQWIYSAGAPKFDLSYTYDDAKHQVLLTVKETQKVEGHVGLFSVPVDVEITTPTEAQIHRLTVSKNSETFPLASNAAPLMVLFDKGGHILKSAEFNKDKKEWLYQLKNASEFSDRADAVVALGKIKSDSSHASNPETPGQPVTSDVVLALGDALRNDKAWGVRAIAADTLGKIGGATALKHLLGALDYAKEPWLRNRIVSAFANFKDDKDVFAKLDAIARDDNSYRARAAALQALGRLKAPGAFANLTAAVAADSPDGFLRNAALRTFGPLGDDKAVPLLLQWSAAGKPLNSRSAAIDSLGSLQKDNKDVTLQIAAYLAEARFSIRMAAVSALGARGDASAVPALEELLKGKGLSIEMVPMIKEQIAHLKKVGGGKPGAHSDGNEEGDEADASHAAGAADQAALTERLDKLERLIQEINERLKSIETRLPPVKK